MFSIFPPFLSLNQNSSVKSDETDDSLDTRNDKKVYNLTDILSTPRSSYRTEWQQKQSKEQHYKSPSSSDEKTKEKRYYIYSHKTVDDATEEINRDDKSRKIRSSSLWDRKQVSKNISMVLNDLLMSYENSQLPTHGEGLSISKSVL